MAERVRTARYVAVLSVGLLALVGCLALIGSVLAGPGGLADAVKVVGLVSFVLTIPPTVVSFWAWSRRWAVPVPVTPEQLSAAKGILADLVAEQWRIEAVLRSLDDPDPIPVQWHLTQNPDVMDHPVNLGDNALKLSVSGDDIADLCDWFRALRRRRVVILGGPGSGKTTVAVQLVRELLATRAQHNEEPVPVLLSAAGWDTVAFPHIQDWIAHRLAQDYPPLRAAQFGTDIPRLLSAHAHVLPVLDGMDELPVPAQAAIIKALNRSLSGTDQIVVTSRTSDYTRAVAGSGDVLTSAVVIEPQPLEPAVAADYLRRCLPRRPGPDWEHVLDHLNDAPGTALAGIVASPFGLWLLRTVYRAPGSAPAVLLDSARFPDAATLRAHLLDQLIGALIDLRPPGKGPGDLFRPRRRHDPARARAWLGYLACLTFDHAARRTRDLMWWRLAHETRAVSRSVRLAMAAVIAMVVALTGSLLTALTEGADGLLPGVGYSSGTGLAAGGLVAVAAGSWSRQLPGFANLRLRGRAPVLVRGLLRGLGQGLALGLVVGLVMGFVVGFHDTPAAGITAGLASVLAVGLTSGLAAGFTAWAENPVPTGQASTPLTSWQADRALNLVRAAAIGCTSGAIAGLVTGLPAMVQDGVPFGLTVGITNAVAFGLAFGFAAGGHHAWMAYRIATLRLAQAGRLPSALMSFLDDCHRLGLLRAVGPVYQFRHAELHEHLALSRLSHHA